MPSLREIRRKIKSVKSTQQITKAMKMVAAARLRRAQARILGARPFADKMESLIADLAPRLPDLSPYPLFVEPPAPRRALVVVSADRGLCGAYNTNIFRRALPLLREAGSSMDLIVVGRKGRDYFRRVGVPLAKEYTGILGDLKYAQAELIADDLMQTFLNTRQPERSWSRVDLLYNEFKSVLQQQVVVKTLLPIARPVASAERPVDTWPDFLYEPAREHLLAALLPRFVKSQVFRALLEAAAAELGARMAAMDNATRNAGELMDSLTLRMNRTRQSAITNEILEVVSGAEALK